MDLSYDPPEEFRTALDLLHDSVSKETGSTDFGPDDYLPGLKVLLQSMDLKPELARGSHRYIIADYGMTEAEAREPFREYIQRYDLLEAGKG